MSETVIVLENLLLILSVASLVAILVKRIHVPYTVYYLTSRTRQSYPFRWSHIMLWGGLKGSIPIALVLGLPRDIPFRAEFLVLTAILVFFSLVVQSLTMKPLVKALR